MPKRAMPSYTAKAEEAPSFTDLGERPSDMMPSLDKVARKKSYPTLHIHKRVKGLDKVGATKTLRMKVRVHSMEERNGEIPHIGLEVHRIHHDEV